jgi:GNAT superfamily N-acetyltransferase
VILPAQRRFRAPSRSTERDTKATYGRRLNARPQVAVRCPRWSLCLCEADGLIRQLEPNDWRRLREARLRGLASDPGAFLVTLDEARKFPDERWRERAVQTETNVTFVYERADVFDAMVGAFVGDNAVSVYLVGMWVAPDLRGSGVARQLVERVVAWARSCGCSRVVLSVEGNNGRAARFYEKCGFTELVKPPPLPYEPRPGNRFYAYTL